MEIDREKLAAEIKRKIDAYCETFFYDGWTGALIWRSTKQEAGFINSSGYLQVEFMGKYVLVHRIVWGIVTGIPPTAEIDHINRDTLDNRWLNLREASRSQNCGNTKINKRNTSGHKGVSFHAHTGLWRARIGGGRRGVRRSLGLFKTPENAATAYNIAASDHFGEFARTSDV